jgi:photosystem II stability/assembly factor-like uncharacterized protein
MLGFAVSPAFARDGICFIARDGGLLKTSDHGRTWQPLYGDAGETTDFPTTAVAVSPSFTQDGVVLAAIPGGIGRSSDAGATWRFVRLPTPPPMISSIALSPAFGQDGCAFAGTALDGVLRTDDGGDSWQSWNAGLLDHEVLSLALSREFGTDCTVFAGTGTGLFQSRNGGRRWSMCGDTLPGGVAILSLAAGAHGILFAGTERDGLWRSLDLGESWRRLTDDVLPKVIESVLISATGNVLVLGDGMAATSNDGGDAWHAVDGVPDDEKAALVAALRAS